MITIPFQGIAMWCSKCGDEKECTITQVTPLSRNSTLVAGRCTCCGTEQTTILKTYCFKAGADKAKVATTGFGHGGGGGPCTGNEKDGFVAKQQVARQQVESKERNAMENNIYRTHFKANKLLDALVEEIELPEFYEASIREWLDIMVKCWELK